MPNWQEDNYGAQQVLEQLVSKFQRSLLYNELFNFDPFLSGSDLPPSLKSLVKFLFGLESGMESIQEYRDLNSSSVRSDGGGIWTALFVSLAILSCKCCLMTDTRGDFI